MEFQESKFQAKLRAQTDRYRARKKVPLGLERGEGALVRAAFLLSRPHLAFFDFPSEVRHATLFGIFPTLSHPGVRLPRVLRCGFVVRVQR